MFHCLARHHTTFPYKALPIIYMAALRLLNQSGAVLSWPLMGPAFHILFTPSNGSPFRGASWATNPCEKSKRAPTIEGHSRPRLRRWHSFNNGQPNGNQWITVTNNWHCEKWIFRECLITIRSRDSRNYSQDALPTVWGVGVLDSIGAT